MWKNLCKIGSSQAPFFIILVDFAYGQKTRKIYCFSFPKFSHTRWHPELSCQKGLEKLDIRQNHCPSNWKTYLSFRPHLWPEFIASICQSCQCVHRTLKVEPKWLSWLEVSSIQRSCLKTQSLSMWALECVNEINISGVRMFNHPSGICL